MKVKEMFERKIGFDRSQLDEGKIVEDEKYLIAKDAVIASEIVQRYPDGLAYKPADELEKTVWTFDGRWVTILKHPDTRLLQRTSDIYGRVENPRFVKDLIDQKTKRPCRRGIRADIKWFKDRVPADVQERIKIGDLRDVSIGFTYDEDRTQGEWEGQKYDYVQRNIFGDHLAAPVEAGRCPGPVCGIGVDAIIKIGLDPYKSVEDLPEAVKKLSEEAQRMFLEVFNSALKEYDGDEEKALATAWSAVNEKYRGSKADEKPSSIRQVDSEDGEVYCVKDKGVKADLWVAMCKTHFTGLFDPAAEDCPVCYEIYRLGIVGFSQRLNTKFGRDAIIEALKDNVVGDKKGGEEKMGEKKQGDVLDVVSENRKAIAEARIIFSDLFSG